MRVSLRLMALWLLAPCLAVAQPSPGGVVPDMTALLAPYAKTSDMPTTLAPYAKTTDVPVPCGVIPSQDTLNGSVGTGTCYRRSTDTHATDIQRANTTTASDGTFTVTWARAFVSSSPIVVIIPLNSSAAAPVTCNPSTRSTTVVTGKCWVGISTTLGGTLLAIVGLVITPFGSAAGSMPLMVVAGEPSQ